MVTRTERDGRVESVTRLLKAYEVQDRLGLGRSKVYELMASGELPTVRLGPRTTRVPEDGLRRYIDQRRSDLDVAA
jgi:excisionase family DNA binding protein